MGNTPPRVPSWSERFRPKTATILEDGKGMEILLSGVKVRLISWQLDIILSFHY
jgi:hypothetical protein